MLKALREVEGVNGRLDTTLIDAIAGEADRINREQHIDPLDSMLFAARCWTDLESGRFSAGRGGSHVWVRDNLLGRRVLIITDESARRSA